MKRTAALVTAFLTLFVFASCGAQSKGEVSGDMSVNESADNMYDAEYESPDMPMTGGSGEVLPANRKFILNYSATLQTLEFDKAVSGLESMVSNAGGYIESSSRHGSGAVDYGRVYARSASYTLRIPADKAGQMVGSLSQIGSVVESSQSRDDVTDYYYDTEAHLKTLRAQEERLLELLAEADSVDTMLSIESNLADVRYQIESLDGTLLRIQTEIDYSRVDIYIEEVFTPEELESSPLTLGERIVHRFKASFSGIRNGAEDLVVFLLGDILIIFPIVVIGVILVKIYKKKSKKLSKSPDEPKSEEK